MNEAKQIAKRFAKYGVTTSLVKTIVRNGQAHGMSRKVALIGARLALAQEFGQHEYFTPEDVAAVTGETVQEVIQRMEENKDELERIGGLVQMRPGSHHPNIIS